MRKRPSSKQSLFIILTLIAAGLIINSIINPAKPAAEVAQPTPTPLPSPTPKPVVMVPCTASASATPQTIPGWTTTLYPGVMTTTPPTPDQQTTLASSYSLAAITAFKNKPNIFYRIERSNGQPLPEGTKRVLEVCNSDNQTVALNTTADTNMGGSHSEAVSITATMTSYTIPPQPGTYRLDGFVLVKGKWILTNRINGVVITP